MNASHAAIEEMIKNLQKAENTQFEKIASRYGKDMELSEIILKHQKNPETTKTIEKLKQLLIERRFETSGTTHLQLSDRRDHHKNITQRTQEQK